MNQYHDMWDETRQWEPVDEVDFHNVIDVLNNNLYFKLKDPVFNEIQTQFYFEIKETYED